MDGVTVRRREKRISARWDCNGMGHPFDLMTFIFLVLKAFKRFPIESVVLSRVRSIRYQLGRNLITFAIEIVSALFLCGPIKSFSLVFKRSFLCFLD